MLFKGKKPKVSRTEALAAKPIAMVEARIDRNDAGGGKLKVPMKSPRYGGWLFRVPEGSTKTFELDEIGVMVWENCDGKTSVQQIIRRLSKQYNLNLREAEVATLRFLQTLAKKGLIGMSVKKKDGV